MSERTRLDEIVEEELHRCAHTGGRCDCNKRIAERAFRHGVERERKMWCTGYRPVDPADEVQPAPAVTVVADCDLCGHVAHTGACAHGRAMHHGSTCKCASPQPAPAEEKEWTQADSAAFWRRQCAPAEEKPLHWHGNMDPGSSGCWRCKDRRKGERRKTWIDLEYFQIGRRSGKDRRKT